MNTPVPLVTADIEQAREVGGMIALIPREEDAARYALAGAELPENLHVTLLFLGDDVSGMDCSGIQRVLDHIVPQFDVLVAKLFGVGLFGPHGDWPCAVYLVGDNSDLPELHRAILDDIQSLTDHPLPEQHEPTVFHMTTDYKATGGLVPFTLSNMVDKLKGGGEIVFDRIELHFADQRFTWPLTL